MEVLQQIIGRLHPVVVHLPIGFIILGLLLTWVDSRSKELDRAIQLAFLWGGIAAVLACVTGYLQYLGEGYAYDTVKWHLWSGIVTALFSFLMYLRTLKVKEFKFLERAPTLLLSISFFLLISFTGHQGGNITHGEGYLVEPLPNSMKSALGFETFDKETIVLNPENWEDALVYDAIIQPILSNNCVSCHGPKKTKGELQLHSPEAIMNGGENGPIISAKNPEDSELYTRLVLPKDHEDHMPPKDKKQPTTEEIELLQTWIAIGNPFDGTLREHGLQRALFLSFFPKKHDADYPDLLVSAASQDTIALIKGQGFHVERIDLSSNFLEVSCINRPSFSDSDFEVLGPLREQIAILDLGGTQVTDAIFEKLAGLPNLTVLKLDATAITGKNLAVLAPLDYLKSINFTKSQLEQSYFQDIAQLKKLEKVHVFGTKVSGPGVDPLTHSKIQVDYGNYEVPPLPSDSIVY